MSILTNITQANIKDATKELNGRAVTRPALLVTDGVGLTYAIDVDIGQDEILKNVPIARGNKDTFYADVGAAVRLRRTESGGFEVSGFSHELPGTRIRIPVSIPYLPFGDAGTGGAYMSPESIVVGDPQDVTLTGRLLTYEELDTYGGYGTVPYGASGIFKGGVLQEIK